jgi:chitinase
MKKLSRLRSCFFFIAILALLSLKGFTQDQISGYKIIAYMMGARAPEYPDSQIRMLTHINYAFAKVVEGEITFPARNPEQQQRTKQSVERIIGLKKINPDVKVILSVGGWGAEGFSDAALTNESRQRFAASGCRVVKEYGFDGIDIDWEYPGQPGGGNVFRPEDKQNFTLMLKTLREHLDRLSRELNRKKSDYLLLTVATGADQAFIDHTDMGEAQKYLDFINIMTYDFHSGLHPKSGHHTNLYKSKIPGASDISTEIAVDRHIQAGIPADKLVIGVPFYGRFWTGVPEESNGLYQQTKSVGNYKIYQDIKDNYLTSKSFEQHWDPDAQAPFLYSKDSAMMISYDNPKSLKLKAEYLKKRKLAGVMFWEYSGDRKGELLETLYHSLILKE